MKRVSAYVDGSEGDQQPHLVTLRFRSSGRSQGSRARHDLLSLGESRAADERDELYETVFLPIVDALAPIE